MLQNGASTSQLRRYHFPQSWLTGLVASRRNQHLPTTTLALSPILADRFRCFKIVPAPPNNDFTPILGIGCFNISTTINPILADRFGYVNVAAAPPNNDFTPNIADRFGCLHLRTTTTLPQSRLTGLVASERRNGASTSQGNDFTQILS